MAICDDAINDWWDMLKDMPSYFHCYDRPAFSLARWGVTRIPPSSLPLLIKAISANTRSEYINDALEVLALLHDAKAREAFVIHYGIWR